MLKLLLAFIFIPGFFFTAVVGLLSTWIDRKITARLQWRLGPPWYQPFADMFKLLGKEIIVPEGASKIVFLSVPVFGLAAVTLVSTILWLINLNPARGFIGDLIVIIYMLTIPSICLMIGGSSSRNPLSAIGASREMKLILAYELPFLLAIFTVIQRSNSIIIGNILNNQAVNGMIVSRPSGLIAFIVAVLVVQAKLGYVPFDMPEAEQEIMGGTLLEYSGTPLAIFKLTKAMLLFTLPVLLITLFLGGTSGIWGFLFKYVIILTMIILIKNTNPRIRTDQAVRFFWGPVTALAILGLILSMAGI